MATKMANPTDIMPRLNAYVSLVTSLNIKWHDAMGYTHTPAPVASVSIGKRYAKIVLDHVSLHSFVDLENGNIIRGTWRAPIRTPGRGLAVRGNIFADDLGESKIDDQGPRDLR